jgi:hypothetical protein
VSMLESYDEEQSSPQHPCTPTQSPRREQELEHTRYFRLGSYNTPEDIWPTSGKHSPTSSRCSQGASSQHRPFLTRGSTTTALPHGHMGERNSPRNTWQVLCAEYRPIWNRNESTRRDAQARDVLSNLNFGTNCPRRCDQEVSQLGARIGCVTGRGRVLELVSCRMDDGPQRSLFSCRKYNGKSNRRKTITSQLGDVVVR